MSSTFTRIRQLVAAGEARISEHGYDELTEHEILAGEVVDGIEDGVVIEDYPDYPKGPCVLIRQADTQGRPIHAVWGIPRGREAPAVLVTAYRPDPKKWNDDFRRRKP